MYQQSSDPIGNNGGNGKSIVGNEGTTIDTSNLDPIDGVDERGKRRGGWPKGKPRVARDTAGTAGNADSGTSSSRKTKEKVHIDLSGIEAALVGIHAGLAMLTKNPVWEMPASEAESLAKATANVARHYPTLAGHEKLIDWVMLIQVVAASYGTRLYMSMPEKKNTKTEKTSPDLFTGGIPTH